MKTLRDSPDCVESEISATCPLPVQSATSGPVHRSSYMNTCMMRELRAIEVRLSQYYKTRVLTLYVTIFVVEIGGSNRNRRSHFYQVFNLAVNQDAA